MAHQLELGKLTMFIELSNDDYLAFKKLMDVPDRPLKEAARLARVANIFGGDDLAFILAGIEAGEGLTIGINITR